MCVYMARTISHSFIANELTLFDAFRFDSRKREINVKFIQSYLLWVHFSF